MYPVCLLWAIVLVSNLRFFFFAYFRSEGCFPRHTFCIYTEVCAPDFRVGLAARFRVKVSPVLYRWPTAPASCIERATIELTLNQPKTQLGIMYRLCVLSLNCMSLQDTINTTVWIMVAREDVQIWPEWLQPLLWGSLDCYGACTFPVSFRMRLICICKVPLENLWGCSHRLC